MPTPQEFSSQLDEALASSQKTMAEKPQPTYADRFDSTAQVAIRASKEAKKNQLALELEAQLPIRQYLEILGDKITQEKKVRRFGPEKGGIAYALIYGVDTKNIVIGQHEEWQGYQHGARSGPETIREYGLREVKRILGLRFNYEGKLVLNNRECAESQSYNNSKIGLGQFEQEENPLHWRRKYDTVLGSVKTYITNNPLEPMVLKGEEIEEGNMGTINVVSPNGLQQLRQTLTDFYVGLKTGQGK